MTRSTAPLSLGRIGLANGGPGGCRPLNTVHKHGNEHTHTRTHTRLIDTHIPAVTSRFIHRLYNLPTPGMGEQGVLGTAPWRTEADRADLSGGPPGAERGTGSVGRATWQKDTHRCLKELSQRQLDLLLVPVA